jgi:hypothetical protein
MAILLVDGNQLRRSDERQFELEGWISPAPFGRPDDRNRGTG